MTFRVGRSPHEHAFMRGLILALAATLLCACVAFTEPAVTVEYRAGVPYVLLDGNYRGSHYTVSRADAPNAEFRAIAVTDALCLGECFGADETAEPGHTYYYRFDLAMADGTYLSYGPYAVTISAQLAARLSAFRRIRCVTARELRCCSPGASGLRCRSPRRDLRSPGPRAPRATSRHTGARGDDARVGWSRRRRPHPPAGVYLLRLDSPLGRSIAHRSGQLTHFATH